MQDVIDRIDPSLKYVRTLKDGVYLVEQNGLYVLKATDLRSVNTERSILEICKNVKGITHLVRPYETAVLKEYFHGEELGMAISMPEYIEILSYVYDNLVPVKKRIRKLDMSDEAKNKLRQTVKEMHSLDVAHLDISGENIIYNGTEAILTDVDVAVTKNEMEDQEFFDHVAELDNLLLELWLY